MLIQGEMLDLFYSSLWVSPILEQKIQGLRCLEVSCEADSSGAFDSFMSLLVFELLCLPEHYVKCLQDVHHVLRNPQCVIIHSECNDCSPLDEWRL